MGPLEGYTFIELAGIGPSQLCGMLLAEMGAEVIRVDRPGAAQPESPLPERFNLMNRSRPSIAVDLKHPQGVETVLRLVEHANAIFEGFRPGVTERLGLGPEVCLKRNPRLVYGRLTGWGQSGPLAGSVGHDPNFIALTGALGAIGGPEGPPVAPLNLVGDFGGGALYMVAGLLAALLETARSGKGQVVDAAMVDGAASMMTLFYGLTAAGLWSDRRGTNIFDGGAHFHRAYRTKDGGHVVVGALEPRFHQALLKGLEIDQDELGDYMSPGRWPAFQARLAEIFRTRTRAEWCELLEGTEACLSPVLAMDEAPDHPHNRARETFVEVDGIVQPGPAPRFERTPSEIRSTPPEPGQDTDEVLSRWGFSAQEIHRLAENGAIGSSEGR